MDCENKTRLNTDNSCAESVVVAYLDNNRFSDLRSALDGLPNLKCLYLRHNFLDELGNLGGSFQKLVYLHLGGNRIRAVSREDLENFKSLRFLSLAQNKITTIEANSFPSNIVLLDLSCNRIAKMQEDTFLGNTALGSLYLKENLIGNLTFLKHLGNVEHLDLSSNTISELPLNVFSNLKKLRVLNLSFNKLLQISFGTFNHNRKLQTLDVSDNKLLELCTYPLFNFELVYLDVRHNRLKKLDITYKTDGICTSKLEVFIDSNEWNCHLLIAVDQMSCVKLMYSYNETVANVNGIACIDQKSDDHNTDTSEERAYPSSVVKKIQPINDVMYLITLLLPLLVMIFTIIIAAICVLTQRNDLKYSKITPRKCKFQFFLHIPERKYVPIFLASEAPGSESYQYYLKPVCPKSPPCYQYLVINAEGEKEEHIYETVN